MVNMIKILQLRVIVGKNKHWYMAVSIDLWLHIGDMGFDITSATVCIIHHDKYTDLCTKILRYGYWQEKRNEAMIANEYREYVS